MKRMPAPVAVVPMRSGGKTRLAGQLDPGERAALSGAMLADVVAAIAAAPVARIVVATAGPEAAAAAGALGVEVLTEPHAVGLRAGLRAAEARLPRAQPLLIVMADLPSLTAADVTRIVDERADVVVARTQDGGTGALLRRPADAIGTAYGPESARRHRQLARRRGLTCATLDLPGLRTDVDTWDDLATLEPTAVGAATAAFLSRVRGRLSA